MTELLIFWTIVLIVAGLLAAVRDVHGDGFGRRQPPASHLPDEFDPTRRMRVS